MKASAVIVITRGEGESLEVLWSHRQHHMAFLGGFWAFAGGSVDPGDDAIPLSTPPVEGFPGADFFGCAAREIFEEHGLLVTTDGLRHVALDPQLRELRDRVLDGGDFGEMLRDRGLSVDIERFWPLSHWVTPEWFDLRFDTEFFALHLDGQESERLAEALTTDLLEAELLEARWTSPAAAIDAWRRAELFMTTPIRFVMEALHDARTVRDVDLDPAGIEFTYDAWLATEGIYLIPLKSPTIPPATHTNCIIVGENQLLVIDPGSPYREQQELLGRVLDEMVEDGKEITAVVLTHHHPDHVGGVEAVVERYGCEVWAHPATADLVDFTVDRALADGERIGETSDELRVVHTPGHASDHICLFHERTGGLIGGDLIASQGTILVNPPDGHMGDYLDSLRLARDLEPTAMYPAHGWIVTNPGERLTFYENHRLAREEKVFDALVRFDGPATPMDLVPDAYDDAPKAVWPIAARSAQAHLAHLVELGRANEVDGKWSA